MFVLSPCIVHLGHRTCAAVLNHNDKDFVVVLKILTIWLATEHKRDLRCCSHVKARTHTDVGWKLITEK